MTPEQAAVFVGHEKRLSYRLICAEGERHAYECRSLGLTEIQLYPKRRKSDVRVPATRRHWILEGCNREFYSLAEVANEILRRRKWSGDSVADRPQLEVNGHGGLTPAARRKPGQPALVKHSAAETTSRQHW